MEKRTGALADKKRASMNRDLELKPENIPSDIWQAFRIKRLGEREQTINDEVRAE